MSDMMSVAAQGTGDADGYDDVSAELLYEPVEGEVGLFRDGVDVPYAIKLEGDASAVDGIDLYTGRERSREEVADHIGAGDGYDTTFDHDDLMDDDLYARIRNDDSGPTVEYGDGTVERLETLEDGDVTYLVGMDEIGLDEPGRYALKTDVTYEDGTVESTGWTGAAIVDEFGLTDAYDTFRDGWGEALESTESYDNEAGCWNPETSGPRGFRQAVADVREPDNIDRAFDWTTSQIGQVLEHTAASIIGEKLKQMGKS